MCNYTGDNSENVSGTNSIDSRCVVDFRPNDDWKGEYGFDWFRIGDIAERVNNVNRADNYTDYNRIVGDYDPYDPDHDGLNDDFDVHYDFLGREYPVIDIKGIRDRCDRQEYQIPYISLYFMSEKKWEKVEEENNRLRSMDFCKTKATVKVLINAENITKIDFSCDDSLTVEPKELKSVPDGKSVQRITIRHNYAFTDEHQSVKAFAYHKDGTKTFAGQINVVKCEPKSVNICFVNVVIKRRCGSISLGIPDNKFSDAEKNNLRRFLSQPQVIPHFTTKKLELVETRDFTVPDALLFTNKELGGDIWNRIIKEKFRSKTELESRKDNILERIKTQFDEKCKEENWKLDHYYKVFFLNIKVVIDDTIRGETQEIPSKCMYIYRKGEDESVVCHELLHCFGLYHSFSNKNRETLIFKQYETNNIMDYSKCKFSLWRWQWNLIRKAKDVGVFNVNRRKWQKQLEKKIAST